jgi:DNA-directed RNA polymerase subunit M/transcription elongation factor TFIIS
MASKKDKDNGKEEKKVKDENLNVAAAAFKEGAQPIPFHCKNCRKKSMVWAVPGTEDFKCPRCGQKVRGFFI